MDTIDTLRSCAAGQWRSIFMTFAPMLERAMDRAPRHVPCPVHDGQHGDGFRLFRDWEQTGGGVCNTCGPQKHGFGLLTWVNGWPFRETLRVVARFLDGGNRPARPTVLRRPVKVEKKPTFSKERHLKILELWEHAAPIAETKGEVYLSRRLGQPCPDISPAHVRFHPAVRYYDRKRQFVCRYPAILCLLHDVRGRIITLQRTYLTADGQAKAPMNDAKKTLPVSLHGTEGLHCKVFPASGPQLFLAEGLETAVAFHVITGLPVWTTAGTAYLRSFRFPPSITTPGAALDNDRNRASIAAAAVLQERYPNLLSVMPDDRELRPRDKKVDWCDVLKRANDEGRACAKPPGLNGETIF